MRVSSTNVSCDPDAVARGVEPQLLEPDRVADRPRRAGAAQQGPQARLQLADIERLDEVVVGARVEPVDAVRDRVARGQHQDRDAIARPAQLAADLEPVDARHADIEHERIGHERAGLRERGWPSSAACTS